MGILCQFPDPIPNASLALPFGTIPLIISITLLAFGLG